MTVDIATLGIALDSRPVTEGTAALDRLVDTSTRVEKSMQGMNGQMNDTAAIMRKNAEASSSASEAAQRFLAPLQREIDLFGLSRAETEKYNAAKAGLTATTQRQAAALGAAIDAMQRDEQAARAFAASQDQATRAADQFLKKLNDQVAVLGMNAQQLQTYRAAQLGVSDAAAPLIARLGEAGAGAHSTGKHMEGLNFQTVAARRELLVLAHELSQGNYQKFGGSMMVLGEQTGAAGLLFSAAGLAALALVGSLGLLAYATIKGSLDQKHMNDALIMTGNYAGLTSDSLNGLAHAAVAAGGSIGEAKKVATELAGSGKFTGDQIAYITEATVAWEHATGQSVKSIIKDFESLAVQTTGNNMRATEAISRATVKLDDQYHFLTVSIYEQIRALEKEGDAKGASALATETFAKATHDRAEEIVHNLGTIARGWNAIKESIGGAIDRAGDWGKKATPASEVARLTVALKSPDMLPGVYNAETRNAAVAQATRELTQAQNDLNAANAKASAQAAASLVQSEGVHAASRIAADDAKLQKRGMAELQVALSQYADDVAKVKTANPASALVTDDAVAAHVAAITKAHTANVKGKDDRAKTLQDALVIEQTSFEREKSIYDAREKMLTLYHSKFGVSDADFYAGRSNARAEYVAAEAIAFAKESALIQGYKPKNAEEIAANKTKYDELLRQHLKFVDDMRNAGGDDSATATAAVKKQYDDYSKAIAAAGDAEIKSVDAAIAKQREHNAEIGKSKAQIELAKQAQTDAGTALLQIEDDAIRALLTEVDLQGVLIGKDREIYSERLAYLDRIIAKRKEVAELLASGAVLEADAKAAAEASRAWKHTANTIENDLTNAILDGGGRGWKRLVRDMQTAFARMVLSPILQPISAGIASMVNPMAPQAGGGSMLSSIGTAGNLGSAASGIAGGANIFGSLASGSGVVGQFLSGVSGSAAVAAEALGAEMTVAAAAGSELAAAFASAVPWVAAAAVAYMAWNAIFEDGPESNTRLGFTSNNTPGNISINERGNEGKSNSYIDNYGTSALGTFGVNSSFWMSSSTPVVQSFIKTVSQTDDALAMFMTSAEKASVTGYLTGKSYTASLGAEGSNPNENGALDTVFRSRLNNIFEGLGAEMSGLLNGFDGTSRELATEAAAILQFRQALTSGSEAVFGAKVTMQDLVALKTPTEATSAALVRITGEFNATNQVLDLLGKTSQQAFGSSGLASEAARAQLVLLSGGVAAMSTQAASFAQNYFSDAERLIPVSKALDTAMAGLGLQTIPTTNKQFRALIDGLTSSGAIATEAGAKQFTGLMSLADAFAQVHPLIEDTTDALRTQADILNERNDLQKQLDELTLSSTQLLLKQRMALDASNRGLFDQIQAAQKAKDAQDAARSSLDDFLGQMKSFADTTKGLNGSLLTGSMSTLTPEQQYAETSRQLDQTLAAIRAGDTGAQGNLKSVEDAFLAASMKSNSGDSLYASDFARVLKVNDEISQWASGQIDTAQASLDALNAQVIGINDLNATMGIVADAINGLPAAFGATPPAVSMPAPVLNYSTMGTANTEALVVEVRALRVSNESMAAELNGMRADANKNTGNAIVANDQVQQANAGTIVSGLGGAINRAILAARKVSLE